jgi:SagB-type dehydrogenase family enzyme
MNRRFFLGSVAVLSISFMAALRSGLTWAKGLPSDPGAGTAGSPGPDMLALPPFEKNGAFALEKALLARKSVKSYDPARKLSKEEISRLLWAATGVNREDGRRTVASAMAKYPVDVLVALPEGVYLYEPKGHQLKKIISEDIREMIPKQEGFKKASMTVLYVINKDKTPSGKLEWADLEIGCIGQSLFLEAVSMGLGSCIYANISFETVTKALGLKENQILRIAQAVGAAK